MNTVLAIFPACLQSGGFQGNLHSILAFLCFLIKGGKMVNITEKIKEYVEALPPGRLPPADNSPSRIEEEMRKTQSKTSPSMDVISC